MPSGLDVCFYWTSFLGRLLFDNLLYLGGFKKYICFITCLSVSLTRTGTDNLLLLNIEQEMRRKPKESLFCKKDKELKELNALVLKGILIEFFFLTLVRANISSTTSWKL